MTETTPVEAGHHQRWWALGVLCLALGMVSLDNTILNVAVPSIARDLKANASGLQWVTTSYGLVLAGLLLPVGVLGDRRGRKGLLVVGLTIFGLASACAAFAISITHLALGRGLMGFGGACTMPATLSLLGNIFPAHERGRAIAIWSGTAGVAAAAGPIVGGVLLNRFWWGSVLLVNLPVAAVAIVAALVLVPRSSDPTSPPIDRSSSLLWWAALTTAVVAIIEGPEKGWLSPIVLLAAGASVVSFVGFRHNERRSSGPLVDNATVRDPRMVSGVITMTALFFAMFGTQFVLTQLIQGPLGYTPLVAGLCFAPNAAASIISSLLNPRLVSQVGHVTVAAGGLCSVAAGAFAATLAVEADSLLGVAVASTFIGFGLGAAAPSGTELIMSSAPPERAGSAAGVNETIIEASGALGVAVLGSVLAASGDYAWPLPIAAVVAAGAAFGVRRAIKPVSPATHRSRTAPAA